MALKLGARQLQPKFLLFASVTYGLDHSVPAHILFIQVVLFGVALMQICKSLQLEIFSLFQLSAPAVAVKARDNRKVDTINIVRAIKTTYV